MYALIDHDDGVLKVDIEKLLGVYIKKDENANSGFFVVEFRYPLNRIPPTTSVKMSRLESEEKIKAYIYTELRNYLSK